MIKRGRPHGSKSQVTKLTNKEEQVKDLLSKKVSKSAIARMVGVHRHTIIRFAKANGLS